jgi:hypothetical protein
LILNNMGFKNIQRINGKVPTTEFLEMFVNILK